MARYRILIVTLTTAYVVPAGSDIPTKPRQKRISGRFHAKKSPEMVNLGCCSSQNHITSKKLRFRIESTGETTIFGLCVAICISFDRSRISLHTFMKLWFKSQTRPGSTSDGPSSSMGLFTAYHFLCSRDYLFLHACFLQFTHQVVCIRQWGSVLSAGLRFYCQSHTTVWWSRQGGSKHTFRRSQITVWSIRQWGRVRVFCQPHIPVWCNHKWGSLFSARLPYKRLVAVRWFVEEVLRWAI